MVVISCGTVDLYGPLFFGGSYGPPKKKKKKKRKGP